jgi:hypothetical protein
VQGHCYSCEPWRGGEGVGATRVVIDLIKDIGYLIPELSKVIECYRYNPQVISMGFRFEGLPVMVERLRVIVYNTEDRITGRKIVRWLNEKIAYL